MSALSTALREARSRLSDASHEQDEQELRGLLHDAAEFAVVLARIVEGKDLHAAFGAPGDWGYHTPLGKALFEFYSQPKTESPR